MANLAPTLTVEGELQRDVESHDVPHTYRSEFVIMEYCPLKLYLKAHNGVQY